MENQEIALRLLSGSTKIDRMKKSTLDLIKLVNGFVRPLARMGPPSSAWKRFEDENCKWEVAAVLGCEDAAITLMKCWVKGSCGMELAFDNSEIGGFLKNEFVQPVFENLGGFVSGVIEIFPSINKKWQPLINASHINI